MLTYALTMTFVCGMVFGVLLILCVAELIRRHDNKKFAEDFTQHVNGTPETIDLSFPQ